MSNPVSFMNLYISKIQELIATIENLRTANSMIDADSTLVARYFADPTARTDIAAADVTKAHDALVQVIFAYDSGNPTQKSSLFKMLP